MERYLRRNRLAEVMDGIGMGMLLYIAATGWFVWLWGLNVASMTAGLALGTLLWTARSQWRRHTVEKREKALRSRIGAELLLESMLLAEAKEAHFQAALLLEQRWPMSMQSVKEEGVLCHQGEETLLVQCLRMSPESEVSAGDLLAAQRAVKRLGADKGIICSLGKVSSKGLARAEQALIPLRIVERDTLLALAGRMAPATDEQLIELGKRRARSTAPEGVTRLIFRRDKAKRYYGYGLGMLILYILTGARLYAVPGMVCLTMAVLCRRNTGQSERL